MSQEIIQTILDTHDTNSKLSFKEEDGANVEKLSLLLNVGSYSERSVLKDFYVVGSMKDRGERRCSILFVNKKGLQRGNTNITLEFA